MRGSHTNSVHISRLTFKDDKSIEELNCVRCNIFDTDDGRNKK